MAKRKHYKSIEFDLDTKNLDEATSVASFFFRKLRKHLYKFDNGVIIETVDFEYKEMRGR